MEYGDEDVVEEHEVGEQKEQSSTTTTRNYSLSCLRGWMVVAILH